MTEEVHVLEEEEDSQQYETTADADQAIPLSEVVPHTAEETFVNDDAPVDDEPVVASSQDDAEQVTLGKRAFISCLTLATHARGGIQNI